MEKDKLIKKRDLLYNCVHAGLNHNLIEELNELLEAERSLTLLETC